MGVASRISSFLSDLGRPASELRNVNRFLHGSHIAELDRILAKVGTSALTSGEEVYIARTFENFSQAMTRDGFRNPVDHNDRFLRLVSPEFSSRAEARAFRQHWVEGMEELVESRRARAPRASAPGASGPDAAAQARAAEQAAERRAAEAAARARAEATTRANAAEAPVTADLNRAEAARTADAAPSAPAAAAPQPVAPMMGGNRPPSPATEAALKDHEKFRGWAMDRLAAFGEANRLFETGSSQTLVQRFSRLDEMLSAFSIRQLGNPGAARVDAMGNLENADVLFASMVPDVGIRPKGEPIGLVPTSKADPSSVNGRILSYYDNQGTPLQPLISADRASSDDVNRVLQQLLSYRPGVELHIHPSDWEKVRLAVHDRRFNELSERLAGGQRLSPTPGSGAAGANGPSELEDYIQSARITGRVDSAAAGVTGRSMIDIVAGARRDGGTMSETDIGAIRRSHTPATDAVNNATSNAVRDIIDTLRPTAREVSEVQAEMLKLRGNVRDAGMLDTSPLDPNLPPRTIEEISNALRNGEQVKTPELERYISKQIGDSITASERSIVSALETGFRSNKRMPTEEMFTQLERIRRDPDYPTRGSGNSTIPRDINQRLFAGDAVSNSELTTLRAFYRRFFDAASASTDNASGGGTGMLAMARNVLSSMSDNKTASPGSVSRAIHYNTGLPLPSVGRTAIGVGLAVPVVAGGLTAQVFLDPEHPNPWFGRGAVNMLVGDTNGNKADDVAELIYSRMANASYAREMFKEYLGLDLPQNAIAATETNTAVPAAESSPPAVDVRTPEHTAFYTNAINRIHNGPFLVQPSQDVRQALMMYASFQATGKASTLSSEAQTELNANTTAQTQAIAVQRAQNAEQGAIALQEALTGTTPTQEQNTPAPITDSFNIAGFARDLKSLGFADAEINTVQSAYNTAAAGDGFDPGNTQDAQRLRDGLQSIPQEKRNNVLQTLGVSP